MAAGGGAGGDPLGGGARKAALRREHSGIAGKNAFQAYMFCAGRKEKDATATIMLKTLIRVKLSEKSWPQLCQQNGMSSHFPARENRHWKPIF